MDISKLSEDDRIKLLNALNETKDLGCPPEEYRVKGHANCFYCNECKRYALMNSLGMINK